jgi:type I restriction enzyme S subunit
VTNWKEYKLGLVTKVKGGKRLPKGSSLSSIPNHHPYIRVRDMGEKYLPNDNLEFVPDEIFPQIKNYVVSAGNVILSIVGSVGLVSIVNKELDNASLTENCVKILPNESELDSQFLYYFLRSNDGQQQIKQKTVGAVQPKLPIYNINELEINLPPLPTQKAIAEILSSLDDKIELNNQINQNLEALAQALFKQWFVDFEFPDENGEPYKSSGGEMVDSEMGEIPKGWRFSILKEEFNLNMGQSPKGETYNDHGNGMIFFQGRSDFGLRFPSERLFTTDPKKIAKKGETLISVRAPVGDINRALNDCCIGRGLGSIEEKNRFQFYTYYKILSIQLELQSYDNEGTVFGSINKDTLGGIKTIIPRKDLVEKFDHLAKPLDDQIEILSQEIYSLKSLRDTLLPKLISGELEVNESHLEQTF